MASYQEITGTINIILLDAFNAINGNRQSDIKSINHINGVHSAGNPRMAADWIVDVITMVSSPRLECGLAA